ncbi:GIY-YIG nuclease family protein [uncultured Neptuniibacter sp.]|uniref:GIY-YIG nuclease family protein n=1 Tax=uncultured Neptuniibacter sp. TaxID=502143 RepID=UPI00263707EB|nr:GIY-YIG nuclease family protein [uncultured Neptuniibacter sp.]
MSEWFVYIVRCRDNSLYTGVTTAPSRRLRQHNGELVGGAKYTRLRRPVELVWQEVHPDRASASKREYAIKQFSREAKLQLIANAIPSE